MKYYANAKRRELSFNEGDLVFLKLQPNRQKSLAIRQHEKLAPQHFGPYAISTRLARWLTS